MLNAAHFGLPQVRERVFLIGSREGQNFAFPERRRRLSKKSPGARGGGPRRHPRKRMELWFQDEARIGQRNKLTRRWPRRGTRPRAPHDQRADSDTYRGHGVEITRVLISGTRRERCETSVGDSLPEMFGADPAAGDPDDPPQNTPAGPATRSPAPQRPIIAVRSGWDRAPCECRRPYGHACTAPASTQGRKSALLPAAVTGARANAGTQNL
jgi:C-5 cytosine-specific DNA methylase